MEEALIRVKDLCKIFYSDQCFLHLFLLSIRYIKGQASGSPKALPLYAESASLCYQKRYSLHDFFIFLFRICPTFYASSRNALYAFLAS